MSASNIRTRYEHTRRLAITYQFFFDCGTIVCDGGRFGRPAGRLRVLAPLVERFIPLSVGTNNDHEITQIQFKKQLIASYSISTKNKTSNKKKKG